jgi:hypothetical protein
MREEHIISAIPAKRPKGGWQKIAIDAYGLISIYLER